MTVARCWVVDHRCIEIVRKLPNKRMNQILARLTRQNWLSLTLGGPHLIVIRFAKNILTKTLVTNKQTGVELE